MLKIHQRMGLITAVPLLATVISSAGAGGKSTSTSSHDIACRLGRGDSDFIFHHGLLCYPRAQGFRNPDTRADPRA